MKSDDQGEMFKPSLKDRWWEFHRENPRVYILFDRFTRSALGRGHKHISADMIMHRVRWETNVVSSGDEFKVNNNWVAYYARLWMHENTEFEGFFRTRETRA